MRNRTRRALFLIENLDLERATGVDGAQWEHFQLAHLNDDSPFRIDRKSRQVAWSWLSATEGVVDAILDRRDSIYVSINHEEAKEKIRYARGVIEALPESLRPQLQSDNQTTLELANGARLSSFAARPPRGRARANVYLDEFAHVRGDRQIYTGSLPVISKGGRIRIGSSTLGASGMFWELDTQRLRPYPGYTRKVTPWWETFAFSKNPVEARRLAPAMLTVERVERFGNDRITMIYANLDEQDFQQEYEGEYVDESTAWITWEELAQVQDPDHVWVACTARNSQIGVALDAIEQFLQLVQTGKIEAIYAGGMDIGRTRNATEIFLVGLTTVGSYPLRLAITLEQCDFDSQLAVVDALLSRVQITKFLIDHNGIGRNLAENAAKRFPTKAEGVDFTNASKTLWATDAKMLVQKRKTPLPNDRNVAYQIHSIKKVVTASKNLVFDTGRNEKHHADKFWAWALGLAAAQMPAYDDDDDYGSSDSWSTYL